MGVPTARLLRNALGSGAILVAVAAITVGLPALDRSVPGERTVPAGAPYFVSGRVSVVPPSGATVDAGRTRPRQVNGTAVFRLGRLQMAVQVLAFSVGGLEVAANRFRARLTRSGEYRTTPGSQPLLGAAGLPGVQGRFVGNGLAGRYAVFVGGGVSVEIMVLAPPAVLASALPLLQASLYSVAVSGER